MLDNLSKGLDNPSEATVTAEAIAMEMSAIVREAAEPSVPGESIKSAVRRAAFRLGLTYRRVRSYWYTEVRTVPAHEADRLRKARRQMMRDRAARLNAELETLQLRLRDLEG